MHVFEELWMNKKIRICMIGGGRVGKNHSRAITRHVPGTKIIALVEIAADVCEATAKEFEIESQFNSLENALGKVEFDAVVITIPTHLPLTALAAENKKHVFLEKPMALSLAKCDAILKVVEQNSAFLQLGFMRRFDPEFVAASQRIEAGEIGQPLMIKTNTHGYGLPPAWARDLRTSSGMLAEVNPHDWDTLRWLMGSNLERVYSEVANLKGAANQVDTPIFYDNVLVNVKFKNGGLWMKSDVCPCGYGYDARVEIIGEKETMQIGELKGQSIVVTLIVTRAWLLRYSAPGSRGSNGHLSMNWSTLLPQSKMKPFPEPRRLMAGGQWQVF
jgi:predicted dehydrogenase